MIENLIDFLGGYREKTWGELLQKHNLDFRVSHNSQIVRNEKKHYDRIFMRDLQWKKITLPAAIFSFKSLLAGEKASQPWIGIFEYLTKTQKEKIRNAKLDSSEVWQLQEDILEYLYKKEPMLKRMIRQTKVQKKIETWSLYIPGGTFKGAFRIRSQQIFRTVNPKKGCNLHTPSDEGGHIPSKCFVCRMFGSQKNNAHIWFEDGYLSDPNEGILEKHFASLDSIKNRSTDRKSCTHGKNGFFICLWSPFSL